MFSNIKILIYTHNRHQYLERILSYYQDYDLSIIIADSSEMKASQTLLAINSHVTYIHYPGWGLTEKVKDALKKVDTEYVALCADDDFTIPSALIACTKFLDTHPDFSVASGNFASFTYVNQIISWQAGYLNTINRTVGNESAGERYIDVMSDYMQLVYCVSRTQILQDIFEKRPECSLMQLFELYITSLQSIAGKIKMLPIFYGAREQMAITSGAICLTLDQIKKSKYYGSAYRDFQKVVVNAIANKDSSSILIAEKQFKCGTDPYLAMNRRAHGFRLTGTVFEGIKKRFPTLLHLYRILVYGKRIADFTTKEAQTNMLYAEGFPLYDEKSKADMKQIEQAIYAYPIAHENLGKFWIIRRKE